MNGTYGQCNMKFIETQLNIYDTKKKLMREYDDRMVEYFELRNGQYVVRTKSDKEVRTFKP
jgi:hypothetical protein